MKVAILALTITGVCLLPRMVQAQEDMGPISEGGSYGSGLAENVVIQTDPETGSLIIVTDEETNEHIKRIIENVDRPIPQVLIKVLFLEVTHTDDFDLGAEGSFQYGSEGEKDVLEVIYGLSSLGTGGFYRIIDEDLSVTLHALATVGKLEVLSRPSILARQNRGPG